MSSSTLAAPALAPCCTAGCGCAHDTDLEARARAAEQAAWDAAPMSETELWALEADRRVDEAELLAVPVEEQVTALPAPVLAELDPGASLAGIVEDLPLAVAGDQLLVEVVAAAKRLEAWAAARAAQAAAELARRPAMNPVWARAGEYQALNVAGEELALRLGISRAEGRQVVEVGHRAFGRGVLAPTGRALATGQVSWRKACAIVRTLAGHPDPVAFAVQDEVLPGAGRRTPAQVTRDLARALIAIDPQEADARHRRAARRRHVSHPRPLPDGMAALTAVLPAPDAVALDIALHAAARAAKASGERRTIDQLRADALTTMAATALTTGQIGPASSSHACRPPGSPPTNTGAPPDSSPPDSRTPGPLRAVPDRSLADLPDLPDLPDLLRLRRCEPMPLTTPATGRTQIRVTVPLSVLLPPDDAHGPPTQQPDRHHPPGPPGGGPPGRRHPDDSSLDAVGAADAAPTTDRAVIPALDAPVHEVADLEGYGPLPPQLARALALGGTWRRLVTDPRSGAVLDVGRTRYRPPAELAEHVRLRDRTCARPGCTTPATQCDLDHTWPWALGGTTTHTNLNPLCPGDHRLKTTGAAQLTQTAPGVFEWTTAAGLRYRRNLDGTIEHLGPDLGPPPF